MTTYVFENMTADEAANFSSEDTLVFSNASLLPQDVTVTNSNNVLNSTTISANGKSLVFAADELSGGQINFTSSFIAGSEAGLFLGSSGDDAIVIENEDIGNFAYGFAGNDLMGGGSGADVIFGGGGDDSISGGDGNDRLYGFQLSGGTASDDGSDTLDGGAGNDYLQGNAGNDLLFGGEGRDRINGGNNDDYIFGDEGNDTVNGNKGDDSISGGDGNDSLRGGAGDDTILGDAGDDIILGDLGNDIIVGGEGLDLLTGGEGEDVFYFGSGDAAFSDDEEDEFAFFGDTITDFTDGEDLIELEGGVGTGTGNIIHAQQGITLESVEAALVYAQQLLDANDGTSDLAALDVGSDAYLFYNGSGGDEIDSLIKLVGVSAANITVDDFTEFAPT